MAIFEFIVSVSIRVVNSFNMHKYKRRRDSRERVDSHTFQYILPACSSSRDLNSIRKGW